MSSAHGRRGGLPGALAAASLACALAAGTRARGGEAARPSSPDAGASAGTRSDALDAGPAQPPESGPSAPPAAAPTMIEESEAKAEPPPPPPAGEERRAIGAYIREHSDGVRDCYAARLRDEPALQGKLIARFQIGPSGRVIGAFAEGIADRELIACVVEVVRGWQFDKPASGGKLSIAYPYVFKPIAAP